MSDRVYWFSNTIPANTPQATPFTADMSFTAAEVSEIVVIVPPGPAGSVGIQIWSGGGAWVPQTPGSFIVADDYTFNLPQNKAPNNGNWKFVAYNTDFLAHTIQVGFYVNDFVKPPAMANSPVVAL